MNRLGARSNTGEGGDDPDRFTRDDNGRLAAQRDQQVASAASVSRASTRERRRPADQDGKGPSRARAASSPGYKGLTVIAKTRHSTPCGAHLAAAAPRHL